MDQDIKKEFDRLRKFLQEHMVTKQELGRLRSDLPTKRNFDELTDTVVTIAKNFHDNDQELKVVGYRTDRLEQWVKESAKKIGVEYSP